MKKTHFNLIWLNDPNYSNWLVATGDSSSVKCKLCNRTFTLSNMSKGALESHKSGKKHQELESVQTQANRKNLLHSWVTLTSKSGSSTSTLQQPSNSISEPSPISISQQSVPSNIPNESSNSMQSYIDDKESVSKAEILWTLNVITKHQSFRSSSDSNSLFQTMFPDSEIAKQFSCGKTKIMYLCVFGLAPYYEQKLLNILDNVPYYSISFDESLNKVTKNEQMDFHIRYWDTETQQVCSQYFASKFLGHAKANDLQCFRDVTAKLKPQKILQISMDGPNVNHKFYNDLLVEREASELDLPCFIDLGTCSLHVGHGALRKGFEETGWKIERLLRSLFYLFEDSPARRQDYTEITGSSVFPLRFCSVRWVENCSIAERGVFIWNNIEKYVHTIESGPKKNIPKCASFKTVSVAVHEPLTCARLQLFITTANVLEPFLKMFQSSKPMAPFLAEEIHKIFKAIMEKFIKEELLSDSISSLINVNVEESKNHIEINKIKIGYAARKCLSKANVGKVKETEFRYQALSCYKAIILKLKERSPIKLKFVLQLRSLKPQYIIRHPNASVTNFEKLLDSLIELKYLKAPECDTLLTQYRDFLSLIKLDHREKFTEFNLKSENRLDVLYYSIIGNDTKFIELWNLFKMMFTLSHGQAATERGFSINKEVLETNMKEKAIVAERMICDSVNKELSIEKTNDVSKIIINKEMLRYCSKASSAYRVYLLEKCQKEKESTVEAKKSEIRSEIESEEKKKSSLNKVFDRLIKNADELALRAENEKKIGLIAESNVSRKRSIEISNEIEECQRKIKCMKDKLKEF